MNPTDSTAKVAASVAPAVAAAPPKSRKKIATMGPVRTNLEAFGVAILAAVLLKWFCIEAYQIPTSSMQPTLMGDTDANVNDRILVDKLIQTIREPKRWDILVFAYPLQKNQNYVKRMVGMPGDFTPPSRFVRAAIYSTTAVQAANADEGITQTFHILNNFDIPKGVAGEKRGGEVGYDYTLYTVARDPTNLRYYWRTYDDQTIRMVDMKALGLTEPSLAMGGTPKVRLLGVTGTQPIVDMTGQLAGQK